MKKNLYISTVGVFGSALMWLLSFKIMAIWFGPEGVGLFSQLRQIVQAVTIGATFGGTNAVVQGLAEKCNDVDRYHFRAVASRLIGLVGLLMALSVLFFAEPLARLFFSTIAPEVVSTIRWLSLAILLSVAGTYSIAVLNGYRSFRFLAVSQLAGPVALVTVLSGLYFSAVPHQPKLLAWSFVLCFGMTLICGAWGVSILPKVSSELLDKVLYLPKAKEFLKFALSTMVAALSATGTMLLIRSWIIEAHGLAFSGLFEAGWTLTFNYATLFLTACNTIYLPLLTAAASDRDTRLCVLRTAYLVLLGCVFICYILVIFRMPILHLLYSEAFRVSGNILVILSIAVIFRSVSWVYGTMILAAKDASILLLSDLGLNAILLFSAWVALHKYTSIESLSWAFVFSHFIYLVFVVEYARKKNGLMFRREIWPLIVLAVSPIFLMELVKSSTSQAHDVVVFSFLIVGLIVSRTGWNAYRRVGL